MASATTQLEAALRESLLNLLRDRVRGMERSVDVESAIGDVLASVHRTVADFSIESNRILPPGIWYKLPAELRLQSVRWLAPAQRAKMLRVSQDVRSLLISDTSLWTQIVLPSSQVPTAARAVFLLDMLARSGDRPLDLEWKMSRSYESGSLDALSVAVLRAAPRARTLAVNSTFVDSGADTIWTNSMPLLEKLVVANEGFSSSSCSISPTAWSVSKAPILRHIRLRETFLSGAPVEPFRSVVHFEAIVPSSATDGSWDTIWAWFPQLERLVLIVVSHQPALPPPPASLRRVALHGSLSCPAPGRLVRNWKTHNVHVLEIFSSAGPALVHAAEYLMQCSPVLWTASFVKACCPSQTFWGKATFRADNKTAVVWSQSSSHLISQLCAARANKDLASPLRELTLDNFGALHGTFTFPNLHALTIIESERGMRFALGPSRATRLQTPKLRELVVDLTSAEIPQDSLGCIHQLVTQILVIDSGPRLLELTVRLPDALDRQSPEIAEMTDKLAGTVRSVRVDHVPFAIFHDETCPRAKAQV